MPAKRKQARVEPADDSAAAAAAATHTAIDQPPAVPPNDASAAPSASTCGPLNPVFALTGPRGGCLSARVAAEELAQLTDMVDDSVLDVLTAAWTCVGVPADQYWSVRSTPFDRLGNGGTGFHGRMPVAAAPATVLRVPDPHHIQLSFYPTRLEAMAGISYDTQRNMVVLAADRRGGCGSKIFTVLSRDAGARTPHVLHNEENEEGEANAEAETASAPLATSRAAANSVARFVDAVPKLYERCLYVLVDEAAPVDPFFDIDCHFDASADRLAEKLPFLPDLNRTAGPGGGVEDEQIETVLANILQRLKQHVEAYFVTTVAECLVLTSTVQQTQQSGDTGGGALRDLKLSFHVHFRLHNRDAVATVRDLHACLTQLREHVEARLTELKEASTATTTTADQEEWRALQAVRQCVDFGVYTRWRAFRLPYNVKNPLDRGAAFTAVDAAADDLLESQLAQCGVLAPGEGLPSVAVGSIASDLITRLHLSADPAQHGTQQMLLKKMMYRFRALLPVVPGVTRLRADGALKAFLDQHPPRLDSSAPRAFASAVFDLALIQRDNPAHAALRLLHAPQHAGTAAATVENPFRVQRPVFPRSVRRTIHDARRKELVAEVFRCLSPRYAGTVALRRPAALVDHFDQVQPAAPAAATLRDARPVTADGLTVQYEESIRAYYATQKQNKYCLRQDRLHKATYAQLYLTYGSIKVRCYANDCCERCLYIPWSVPRNGEAVAGNAAPGLPAVDGFPQYERLQAIHEELFPPLPLDEIVRRYGTEGNLQP